MKIALEVYNSVSMEMDLICGFLLGFYHPRCDALRMVLGLRLYNYVR